MSAHRSSETNLTAVWALVLSVLGITSPIGLWLSGVAKRQIERSGEVGLAYAQAARWVAIAYLVALVAVLLLGALLFLWG